MNRILLVASLEVVAATEAASAKITEKKNKTAAAIPPRIVIAFIIMCGVVQNDLNLILQSKFRESERFG